MSNNLNLKWSGASEKLFPEKIIYKIFETVSSFHVEEISVFHEIFDSTDNCFICGREK